MPGFQFRYRRGGADPTVRTLVFRNTETLTLGDMLNVVDDGAALGVAGDRALLGAALETLDGDAGATSIRVIIDADAVYGVEDRQARAAGDLLALTGATGAQGVAGSAAEFRVERDSSADQETLVAIAEGSHYGGDPWGALRRPEGSELNAAVARLVTRAYRENTGRGPAKTQAFYHGDVLVVVMEGLMTTAERSLLARGRKGAVLELREAFQEALRAAVVTTVEDLTAAKVRAFMSANHVDPDMAIEVFVLDRPIAGEAPDGR